MIPVFKRILFATDLSENSRHAFFFAASMATRYEGGITLLHVLEKVPSSIEHRLATFLGEERWQKMQRQRESKAKHILIGKKEDHEMIRQAIDIFCDSGSRDLSRCSFDMHEIIIKSGKVVDEITNTAREKGSEVIVIGSHKGFLGATSVDSIVRGVLHQARVPVLVVPPPEVV